MHVVRILPKANAYTSLLIIQRKHCWTGCSEVLPRLPRTKSADERIGRSIIGENTKSFVNPSAVILQLWLYRRRLFSNRGQVLAWDLGTAEDRVRDGMAVIRQQLKIPAMPKLATRH